MLSSCLMRSALSCCTSLSRLQHGCRASAIFFDAASDGLLRYVCDPCISKTTYPSNNLETATAAVFDANRLPTRPHRDICHRISYVMVNKGG